MDRCKVCCKGDSPTAIAEARLPKGCAGSATACCEAQGSYSSHGCTAKAATNAHAEAELLTSPGCGRA